METQLQQPRDYTGLLAASVESEKKHNCRFIDRCPSLSLLVLELIQDYAEWEVK